MQENNAQFAKNIIKRLKKTLKIDTDTSLSEILDIKPNTISSWKKRNTLDYSKIIEKCIDLNIDLNLIFNDNYIKNGLETNTPVIAKNLIYQYTKGELKKSFDLLPKIKFPFLKNKETIAFQTNKNIVNSKNTSDYFTISERVTISEIQEDDLVIIISEKLGFFIKKVRVSKTDSKISFEPIEDKTPFNSGISIAIEDVDEIWKVTGSLTML